MNELQVLERIKQLADTLRYKDATLASIIGIPQTTVSGYTTGKRKVSLAFTLAVLEHFPELSAEWLLRGEGDMFRSNPAGTNAVTITGQNHVGNVNTGIYNEAAKGNNAEDDEITDADFECIEEIPVVPAAAVKAPGVDLMTYVEDNQQHIEQRKVVKGGVIADFIVRVKDVSLMPEYMPGDELYLKEIDIDKGILNGNVYAVDTDSKGMVIRVLNDGGDHFIASSFNNTRFRDSIIQKDDVLRIYNITQLRRIPN